MIFCVIYIHELTRPYKTIHNVYQSNHSPTNPEYKYYTPINNQLENPPNLYITPTPIEPPPPEKLPKTPKLTTGNMHEFPAKKLNAPKIPKILRKFRPIFTRISNIKFKQNIATQTTHHIQTNHKHQLTTSKPTPNNNNTTSPTIQMNINTNPLNPNTNPNNKHNQQTTHLEINYTLTKPTQPNQLTQPNKR
ncbi:uncharacterized protein TM35_001301000 [Trypanosoma theileri]|uniref:Uncharacterized protein n=1 Tax=Trypanosoma theileri TaxID=67003 RepID=A0A1X0NDH2_9TRYP|nr:uncharacterized protein TM35_001301000 [Trypanosoma theileri]ORC81078.1 hypothetical protein TM35_001301000 [Trypanosoma theileri]